MKKKFGFIKYICMCTSNSTFLIDIWEIFNESTEFTFFGHTIERKGRKIHRRFAFVVVIYNIKPYNNNMPTNTKQLEAHNNNNNTNSGSRSSSTSTNSKNKILHWIIINIIIIIIIIEHCQMLKISHQWRTKAAYLMKVPIVECVCICVYVRFAHHFYHHWLFACCFFGCKCDDAINECIKKTLHSSCGPPPQQRQQATIKKGQHHDKQKQEQKKPTHSHTQHSTRTDENSERKLIAKMVTLVEHIMHSYWTLFYYWQQQQQQINTLPNRPS